MIDNSLIKFKVSWQHGPAPGLTYYEGELIVYAHDKLSAGGKARRELNQRACFDPSCITILKAEPQY